MIEKLILAFFLFLSPQSEELKFAAGLFKDGMYTLAREEFLSFIQKNPTSELIPDARYFAAECLYREKKYDEAIKEFDTLQKSYPNSPFAIDATIRKGQAYYAIGKYDEGIRTFNSIKTKKDVSYWLGEGYYQKKEYEKAIEYYKEVKDKEYIDYAILAVGYSYLELKKYDEAVCWFEKLKEGKLAEKAAFMAGKSLFEKGDYQKAIDRLKTVKGEYENEALCLTGDALCKLNRFKEAIPFYKKSRTPLAILGLGDAYFALKEYKNSLNAYKNLVGVSKYQKDAYERMGKCYYALKDYSTAISYFEKVDSYESKLMIGHSLFEKGDYEKALQVYNSLYTETKKKEPLYRLAVTYYKLGKYEEARKKLGLVSEKSAKFSLLLGEIAYKQERYDDAIKEYKIASKSSEVEKEALLGLSFTYLAKKDYRSAYLASRELVEKYPENNTFYHHANCAYLDKKYKEAIEYYKKCDQALALFKIGEIYYEIGEYTKAIDGFKNFLKSYPLHDYSGKSKYLIGMSYRKQAKFNESIKEFTELCKRYPSFENLYDVKCLIGDNYYDARDYENAEKAYRNALELFGDSYPLEALRAINGILDSKYAKEGLGSALSVADLYIERFKDTELARRLILKAGDMSYNNGDYERAIKYYEKVENPDAFYWKANAYLKLKKEQEALTSYNELVNKFGKSEFAPKALYEAGKIYYDKKDYLSSEKNFKAIIDNYKNYDKYGEACLYLAKVYISQGDSLKGEEELQKLLNTEKKESVLMNARLELGYLLLAKGEVDKSRKEFEVILESKVFSILPSARFGLAETYFKEGNYEEACRNYLKVKHLYGENNFITKALFKSALAQEKLGDNIKAKEFYRMVVERNDDPELVRIAKDKLK